jgi:hypothetical protein
VRRIRPSGVAGLVLLVLGLCHARVAGAQAKSGSVSASANVGFPALVFVNANLAFGNTFPSVPKTVLASDGGAGRLTVVFFPGSHVNLSFSLPAHLAGPGASTMPIGAWTGLWNTSNSITGATSFTPSTSPTTVLVGSGAVSYIFIGATISPGAAQTAGTYSGTIVVTGVYAGF